jgi:hypothetical protein
MLDANASSRKAEQSFHEVEVVYSIDMHFIDASDVYTREGFRRTMRSCIQRL